MRVTYYRNLNQHELYTATKKQLKTTFFSLHNLDVSFGLSRRFEWESSCSHHPVITGIVVATAWFHRDRTLSLSLFPIDSAIYSEDAYKEFSQTILGSIKKWMCDQIKKPDTAIVGIEQLVIEWKEDKHLLHSVTFL